MCWEGVSEAKTADESNVELPPFHKPEKSKHDSEITEKPITLSKSSKLRKEPSDLMDEHNSEKNILIYTMLKSSSKSGQVVPAKPNQINIYMTQKEECTSQDQPDTDSSDVEADCEPFQSIYLTSPELT